MTFRACLWMVLALGASGCGLVVIGSELYEAPWPDERLRGDGGTIDMSVFPVGTDAPLRDQVVASLRSADGFGIGSAIYFPMERAIDPGSLPSPEDSMREGASVFLMDVDPSSPELGRRMPIDVRFVEDGGPFGAANLLCALPHQGIPLAPGTLYAAVVTTSVRGQNGRELVAAGVASEAHEHAVRQLEAQHVPAASIASLAVFRTGDPARELRAAVEQARVPALEEAPRLIEEHADYCVYASSVRMPVYQGGEPPFLSRGGGWVYGEDGELVLQREESARVFLTVPRRAMPDAGFPGAVFVRTGGGGDRPLVDRGIRDESGASIPGTGPAVHLARAGFLGVSVDGPLGGDRNTRAWDEQFAVFNVANLEAMKGNVLQSALELVLLARMLDAIAIGSSSCEGAPREARFDAGRVALVGHSMGATIAPLAAALEPRYGALIVSGAGASLIRQVMHKESPISSRSAAELLLGYSLHGDRLYEHDPMLSLMQWSGDASDPISYARAIDERAAPLHVLVFQGLLDHYIPPPIANPLNLALGVELVGPALDEGYPEYTPMESEIALRAPASHGAVRALVQHAEDGVEDGHEVLFQLPGAQRQMRCFLEGFARGEPVVAPPGDPSLPCE
jgi:hypothetical protein